MFLNISENTEDVDISKMPYDLMYVRQNQDTNNRDPTTAEIFQGLRTF